MLIRYILQATPGQKDKLMDIRKYQLKDGKAPLLTALRDIVSYQVDMTMMSGRTGMNRESLYKS